MAALVRAMIMVAILACFASVAFGISGTATFYTDIVPSSCYGNTNVGTMVARVSASVFQNKAACGKMYSIKCISGTKLGVVNPCKGGSVTVKVVDACPGCTEENSFELSGDAFSAMANINLQSKINIDYTPI